MSSKHLIRKDKCAPKKAYFKLTKCNLVSIFYFQWRETKWRGISLQLLTRNKMLKYHFLPLKSCLKKASQSKLYENIWWWEQGGRKTQWENLETWRYTSAAAIKNEEILRIVPLPNVWTSPNPQINLLVGWASFILMLFPRGRMTRSRIVCSILLKPH